MNFNTASIIGALNHLLSNKSVLNLHYILYQRDMQIQVGAAVARQAKPGGIGAAGDRRRRLSVVVAGRRLRVGVVAGFSLTTSGPSAPPCAANAEPSCDAAAEPSVRRRCRALVQCRCRALRATPPPPIHGMRPLHVASSPPRTRPSGESPSPAHRTKIGV